MTRADDQRAFKDEGFLLHELEHPLLPKVTDYFLERDSAFLVMSFVGGDDLSTMLEKRKDGLSPAGVAKPFAIDDVLEWASQLCDVLQYLHDSVPTIVHRDVKPPNLKLGRDGRVRLLDFGIAKRSEASVRAYSRNFSPPEQIMGRGTDRRSDIYSMAATLYYLLTAVLPDDALERHDRVDNGEADPLRSASERCSAVPQAIADALTRGMALDPEHRPPNVMEFRKHLMGESESKVDPAPTPTENPPPLPPNPSTTSKRSFKDASIDQYNEIGVMYGNIIGKQVNNAPDGKSKKRKRQTP